MIKKNIIITGGSSGIGQHISEFLNKKGHQVVNLDLRKNKNKNIYFIKCDLSNTKNIKKSFKIFERKFLKADILINNAAITKSNNLLKYNLKDWNKTIDINLTAPFLLSKFVALNMVKNKIFGSIINITSIGAELAFPDNPAYQASKAGLQHLTKSMAYDLSKFKIRVNNIMPGYTKTNMNKKSWNNKKKNRERAKRTLLNRWANPNELNSAIDFLIDEKSIYVNGIDLKVDGGWTIKGL